MAIGGRFRWQNESDDDYNTDLPRNQQNPNPPDPVPSYEAPPEPTYEPPPPENGGTDSGYGGGGGGSEAPPPITESIARITGDTGAGGAAGGGNPPTPDGTLPDYAPYVQNGGNNLPVFPNYNGWDVNKLNDQNHHTPKYDFLRYALTHNIAPGSARNNLQAIADGMKAQYPNIRVVDDDHIDFGDGAGPVDVILGDNSAYTWIPDSTNKGGGAGTGTGTGAGAGFGGADQGAGAASALINRLLQNILASGRLTGSSTGSAGNPMSDFARQVQEAISRIITEGQQPVGDVSEDPTAVAYRRAQRREADRSRSQALERRASQGLLYSGPAETDIEGIAQHSNEMQSAFEAQLAQTILMDRKDRLERAIAQGSGFINQQQQYQLQSQLQETNAALAQANQYLDFIRLLLQNQQYYDQLGYNYSALENNANSAAGGL
jgi:hypothetical protein